MTHTLHRQGDRESLGDDYVVFAIAAQGINAEGSRDRFRQFAEVVMKYDPVNLGDMATGNRFSVGDPAIMNGFRDNSIVHAVFTDGDTVAQVLRELSELELGPSIVVSGLLDGTAECCHKADIAPHTVEHSLGVWGRTDRLPGAEVLELNTMCGHGMVSFNLIDHLAREVARGMSAERAAEEMARQCHCGVFNPKRGARILTAYAAKIEDADQDTA